MNLRNTILDYHQTIELTDISRTIIDLTIEGKNELVGRMRIADYAQLESIQIEKESLQNVISLHIMSNPLLKSISVGDDSCKNATIIEISSLSHLI